VKFLDLFFFYFEFTIFIYFIFLGGVQPNFSTSQNWVFFSFLAKSGTTTTQKKVQCKGYKGSFFGDKYAPKLPHFQGKINSEVAKFRQ